MDAHLGTGVGLPELLEAGVGVQIGMPSVRFSVRPPLRQIRSPALRHPTSQHPCRKKSRCRRPP